jgi:hypothetical protein
MVASLRTPSAKIALSGWVEKMINRANPLFSAQKSRAIEYHRETTNALNESSVRSH